MISTEPRLVRVRNWDVELVLWARRIIGAPFEWGRTDCGTLCRTAVDVLYGRGTAALALGRPWQTLRGARGAWGRLGGEWPSRLGARAVPARFASGGDIVVSGGADDDGLPQLAVVLGPQVLVVDRDMGVYASPVRASQAEASIWRLP